MRDLGAAILLTALWRLPANEPGIARRSIASCRVFHASSILCIMRTRASLMAARTSLVSNPCGAIAQLGERIVRNDEVVGSSPTSSTNPCGWPRTVHPPKLWLPGCFYLGVFLPTMFSSTTWPSGFFTSNTLPFGAFSLAGNSLPVVQSIKVAAGALARQA